MMSAMDPHTVPPALADVVVKDEDGSDVRLGDLWAKRPLVLAFVRHFGCVFCREHVKELKEQAGRIDVAGADLVVVGSGAPNFIRGFRDATGFTGRVLADATGAAFEAAGMHRSVLSTLNPVSAVKGLASLLRGNKYGGVQGDNYQQGGTLVIIPPGEIVYEYRSRYAGDAPPVAATVSAVETSART
jgi:peroxiredoxin